MKLVGYVWLRRTSHSPRWKAYIPTNGYCCPWRSTMRKPKGGQSPFQLLHLHPYPALTIASSKLGWVLNKSQCGRIPRSRNLRQPQVLYHLANKTAASPGRWRRELRISPGVSGSNRCVVDPMTQYLDLETARLRALLLGI